VHGALLPAEAVFKGQGAQLPEPDCRYEPGLQGAEQTNNVKHFALSSGDRLLSQFIFLGEEIPSLGEGFGIEMSGNVCLSKRH